MASVMKRTRKALAVSERWTPTHPGAGLDNLKQERAERAWRFLCAVTEANEAPLPRFVTNHFLRTLFALNPATARMALGALKEQPKGQPWPSLASAEACQEASP